MFILGDPQMNRGVLALRPMTCPFQYRFLSGTRSYSDLPILLSKPDALPLEDSGECTASSGAPFYASEGHLILIPDQLEEEFRGCLDLARFMLERWAIEDCTSLLPV
jgi:threonyl-tRNA synthetase